jgi:hypothetical protein
MEAYGPYDGRIVKDMIEQSRILPTTVIARVGATEWTEVKDHPFFSRRWAVGSGPGAVLFQAHRASLEHAQKRIRHGGFWIRLAAYLVDGIFIGIAIGITIMVAFRPCYPGPASSRAKSKAAMSCKSSTKAVAP